MSYDLVPDADVADVFVFESIASTPLVSNVL